MVMSAMTFILNKWVQDSIIVCKSGNITTFTGFGGILIWGLFDFLITEKGQ
jgi:hypothetical protein